MFQAIDGRTDLHVVIVSGGATGVELPPSWLAVPNQFPRLPGNDGKPLPTTAQVARQQAVFLARSLARHLRQNRPLTESHFRDIGSGWQGRRRCDEPRSAVV